MRAGWLDSRGTAETPHACAVPVIAAGQVLAVLAAGRGGLADSDLRTLERAALVVAILLLTERQLAEAEQRVRGDLLADLFADTQPEQEGLHRRARLLGVDLDRVHTVVVAFATRDEDRRLVLSALGDFADEMGGLCGEHARAAVALLPGDDPAVAAAHAADRIRRAVTAPVTVGAAGPGEGPVGLRDGYRDARTCVDVLCALDRAGQVATPADLGAFGLLFGPAGAGRIAAFVHSTLGPVLDYDRSRGTDLMRTVEAYFAADGNHARAAAALFIHSNTLYQRIERVNGLLGAGWRTGPATLQVQLAVTLHKIATYLDRRAEGQS